MKNGVNSVELRKDNTEPRLKKCSKCGETRPLFEFYKRTDGSLCAACKSCYRKARAEYVSKMKRINPVSWIKDQNSIKTSSRKKYKEIVFTHYKARCNDYPEREYAQAGGSAPHPISILKRKGEDIVCTVWKHTAAF